MYLLCHDYNCEMIKDEKELMKRLLALTFEWCQEEYYKGPSYKELFDEAVANRNFAGIAQVFSIKPIVTTDYNNFPTCETGKRFLLERVY